MLYFVVGNILLCQIISCQQIFVSLNFVGPCSYENILTMKISPTMDMYIHVILCTLITEILFYLQMEATKTDKKPYRR